MSGIGHNGGPAIRDPGWYATHRDMLSHPIVGICQPVKPADPKRGSASRFEAWHWLIANAAYGEREWMNKGRKQTIEPGQLVAGRQYLASTWNWTEKTVRVFLKQLLDEQMITLATDAIRGQQRANTANIITLCNYLRYQLSEQEVDVAEGPAKGQQRATEGPAKGHIEYKDTNKQINNTPVVAPATPPPPEPSQSPVSVSLREGEIHIGSGVIVNCETIRHAAFTINLLGIEMQLCGTVPMDEIKSVATGHALQWATDIADGKRNVVPSNPANFIRGSIQNQRNKAATAPAKARVPSKYVPRDEGMSFRDVMAAEMDKLDGGRS